jgi:hypothetical protein
VPKPPRNIVKKAKETVAELEKAEPARYWVPGRGKPSRLEKDPGLTAAIFALVREGDSITNAHGACGVPHSTESDWARRGKAGEEPYASHYEALQIAKHQFHSSVVRSVYALGMGGMKGQFMALTWLLERRFKEDYWLSKHVEVTGKDGAELKSMSLEQLIAMAKQAGG